MGEENRDFINVQVSTKLKKRVKQAVASGEFRTEKAYFTCSYE